MTRLKNKLGEAMKPRQVGGSTDAERTDIDSRYERADQVMAEVTAPEAVSSEVPPPVAAPPAARKTKERKRVIRDTFSLPPSDYERIVTLRSRARRKDVEVSKSELVRAGLLALEALPVSDFLAVIARLERVKTGRPELPKTEQKKRQA